MPTYDLRDCSRSVLESFEAGLLRAIAEGREDLRPRLEAVRAQIPLAPNYCITYGERR